MNWPFSKVQGKDEAATQSEIYALGLQGKAAVTFSVKLDDATADWLTALSVECGIPRSTIVREILLWTRCDVFDHWDGSLGLRQFLAQRKVERKG